MNQFFSQLPEILGLENVDITNFQMTDSPIKDGEKVIGDMSDLEKTCFAVLEKESEKHKNLHEQLEKAVGSPEEEFNLEHEHSLLKDRIDILKKIMWSSVSKRFGPKKGTGGWGFREGNKVVTMPPSEQGETSFGFMVLSLGLKG